MTRAHEIRTGLAWLHAADPVLAQVIDEHPDFDPDVWIRRLPALDLFGALVFQIIGQQISVIAATVLAMTSRSRGVSAASGPDRARLAISRAMTSGSTTVPPAAILVIASVNSATSATRSLSR